MTRRAFTVEEANDLIPRMEEVMQRVQELRARMEKHSERIQLLDALWGSELRSPRNPDHEEYLEHRKQVRELIEEIEDLIQEEILERGIRFPTGGLEHGLLDFPTTYRGRWVYLCWRMGESEIRQWHEVDGGYRGRRDVTEAHERVMGKVDDPADVDDSVLDF